MKVKISKEQYEIMNHTKRRAAGGFYCGDSKEMQELIVLGLMRSSGTKSFVPDEYFRLTEKGKEALLYYNPNTGECSVTEDAT
jgi:hypothetical protein